MSMTKAAETVTLEDVEQAAKTLKGALVETPFSLSKTLSLMLGCELWLKFENQQFTASFKERGALNRLAALSEAERRAGVIAMSAGNHGQAVAYHAKRLGSEVGALLPRRYVQRAVGLLGDFAGNGLLRGITLANASVFVMPGPMENGETAKPTLEQLAAWWGRRSGMRPA